MMKLLTQNNKRMTRLQKRERDFLASLCRAALINDGIAYSASDTVDDLLAKLPEFQASGLRKQAKEQSGQRADENWTTPMMAQT
jgi:hypothetical protein